MPRGHIQARAILKVRHERPYAYDEARGVWLFKRLDDDEEYGNILTNRGRVTLHTYIYGTAPQRAAQELGSGFNYIGLSNSGVVPNPSDTALAGELSSNGLERVQGTVSLPTGPGTITLVQRVFTYTGGGTQSVQKTALFDAPAGGNMAHEILFTPPRVLATADTLTMVFSITLT